jgi:hypothetical protein
MNKRTRTLPLAREQFQLHTDYTAYSQKPFRQRRNHYNSKDAITARVTLILK